MTKNLIRNESVHLGNELRFGQYKTFKRPSHKTFDNEIKEIYKLNLSNIISNHCKENLKNKFKKSFSVQNEDGDDSSNYLESNYNNNKISSLNDFGSSQPFDKKKSYEKLKSNLYTSYLNYGTVNPFKSNYDFLQKKNPEFYKKLGKKLPNSDSTYSLLSSSVEIKKFMHRADTKKKEISIEEIDSQKNPNNHDSLNAKNSDAHNCLSQTSSYQSLSKTLAQKNATKETKKATIAPNQFLIYRNETLVTKENSVKTTASSNNLSNDVYVRKKERPREPQGPGQAQYSKTTKEDALVNHTKNDILTEHRSANGPEKFLDSSKLAYILNWVSTVNRVQSIEGKHSDTINKIIFYD